MSLKKNEPLFKCILGLRLTFLAKELTQTDEGLASSIQTLVEMGPAPQKIPSRCFSLSILGKL